MSEEFNNLERPEHKRRKLSLIMNFKINQYPDPARKPLNTEYPAKSLEICEQGLGLVTNEDVPVKSIITLELAFYDLAAKDARKELRSSEVIGEVRSNVADGNGNHHLGIIFTSIDKDDQKIIADFVSRKK